MRSEKWSWKSMRKQTNIILIQIKFNIPRHKNQYQIWCINIKNKFSWNWNLKIRNKEVDERENEMLRFHKVKLYFEAELLEDNFPWYFQHTLSSIIFHDHIFTIFQKMMSRGVWWLLVSCAFKRQTAKEHGKSRLSVKHEESQLNLCSEGCLYTRSYLPNSRAQVSE